MAHSYSHPYPLPFPNKAQRTPKQISSHSSLANAPGTDPGYSIYLTGPPLSNPSYPYPARNVLNLGTYPARTPLSVSNGGCPSNPKVILDDEDGKKDLPKVPSRYSRLPQPLHVEPHQPNGNQGGADFPAIYFRRMGNKEPYSLGELLTMDTLPDLVGGDMPVFVQNPDRWIKIKFTWPGYSHYPFEKRMTIKQGAPLTPALLLMVLAYHMDEFVRWIHNEDAVVEPGQEHWSIKNEVEGIPAMWKNCVVPSLQHRTGSVWQPEIYYLRE